MIQILLQTNDKRILLGTEALNNWIDEASGTLWIDLDGSDLDEESRIFSKIDLPADYLSEAQKPRFPPQFDTTENGFYLLLKPLLFTSVDMEFDTQQLAIFYKPGVVLTRHSKLSPFIDELIEKVSNHEVDLNPLDIADRLIKRLIKRYGDILLSLEKRLDVLEDTLFEHGADEELQELVSYNTSLRKMRRILNYHRHVFQQMNKALSSETPEFSDSMQQHYDMVDRFFTLADMYQGIINDLIEGYISLSSHHLNQIMKVLTIVTVIFVPLSLLVGIYGMNFEYMPELKFHYGYPLLIGAMVTIVMSLILIFRRIKWL